MPEKADPVKRVLVFRVGSLGDTVIALPSFRLIARRFPHAERRLLTHLGGNEKAVAMRAVLDLTGLIDSYFDYTDHDRSIAGTLRLVRKVRDWNPDLLVYLTEPKEVPKIVRDAVFFRILCGIPRIVGLPLSRDCRFPRILDTNGNREREGERLARCIAELGRPDLDGPTAWLMDLADTDRQAAATVLSPLPRDKPILAISLGTKWDVNDWGMANWHELIKRLSTRLPGWSLVTVGGPADVAKSEAVQEDWKGPRVNLCGRLSVGQSAAVLERAAFFIGHDSGPMHLAAAVGTRCVAIFSARNHPGEWFPAGKGHRVIYHRMPCQGCKLAFCHQYNKKCIVSITVDEVLENVDGLLQETGGS